MKNFPCTSQSQHVISQEHYSVIFLPLRVTSDDGADQIKNKNTLNRDLLCPPLPESKARRA